MSRRPYALVAGGGTGGHLVPALAVARALGRGRGEGSVELVGSRRGLDAELLAEAGLPVRLLPGRGFVRRLSPGAAASNVIAVAELAVAVILAFVLVGRRRPAVVVAMGGYASVAGSVAAVLWRVPVVLVNVDAVPGAANRLIGRFARAAAVAFPGTALPRAVVTGAPVRPEIADAAHPDAASRLEARRALGLPEGGQVIGAVGGSLGAARINEALLELARLWADRTDVALYHVVGRRDYQWVAAAGSGAAGAALRYVQVAYEERMALFYRASDVVVCRAGANTVAELAVVGVPAVLVPLPGAPGDHQSANARALAQAGAAVILADDACTGARLADVLEDMLGDPGRLEAMATAGAALGRPDAVEAVAAVVEAEARK
ncbi:MAG TPA: glycosyltransferase [Acidimicrobiales bacterium]|nr:glycosyltransferase [Acidimicrobiales bacterium]